MFRRLAVFAESFNLDAAEAVCTGQDVARGGTLDVIDGLIHKSLVVMYEQDGSAQYRLLEPVGQYAQEFLTASGERDVIGRRHALYYLAFCEARSTDTNIGGPRRFSATSELAREYPNIRRSLAWCVENNEAQWGLRLAASLNFLWQMHDSLTEGLGWVERLLAIPGADVRLKDEEIAFSCHLDHQRPGANDNASGCATILEVARTLQKLIAEGKLARPARTIRFIWPPEIEGTVTLLNAKPEFAKRIKAVVHMDMVGGGPETKAVFHVTRGPMSLPSFVHDVAWAFAEFVNEESYKFAATGKAEFPLVAPEGGKEPLGAVDSAYTMGSDHQVYQDSSFGIPAIYLNDWPDRYIHTNLDTAANIDPTKLKRAAFIGAASGYFLARLNVQNASSGLELSSEARSARLAARMFSRIRGLSKAEEASVKQVFTDYVAGSDESLQAFLGAPRSTSSGTRLNANNAKPGELVFARTATPKGPLEVFGYDYFEEHRRAAGVATPKLLRYEGLWGAGEEYAYEVLNFADGQRNTQKIRDAVSAEYGPVPLELVVEYLLAAEKIGVVEQVK